jgi:hypothetical protein
LLAGFLEGAKTLSITTLGKMSLCYIVTLRSLLNIIVMLPFMLYADCFIILSVVVLKVIMLSAVKLSFLFLSDVLLSVIMLSVIMMALLGELLSVVLLSFVAPRKKRSVVKIIKGHKK